MIAGVIAGGVGAIPVLNLFNQCCCLITVAGVALGLNMHFRENPNDKATYSDAASAGAITGAVAGTIAAVLGWIIGMALASVIASVYSSLPPSMFRFMPSALVRGFIGIPIAILVHTGMGALGGVLSLSLFFKDRSLG